MAAGIPTGTTVELMPLVEAQRAIGPRTVRKIGPQTAREIGAAPKPEAVGLTKIPQQAIDELQRLQAENPSSYRVRII